MSGREKRRVPMTFTVEIEQEEDGRWITEALNCLAS